MNKEKFTNIGDLLIFLYSEKILVQTGIGNALIDTGAQVSLVKKGRLTRGSEIIRDITCIHGITGDSLNIEGQTDLIVGDSSPHKFLVLEKLPMDYDVILGQDWLERFGFQIRIPSLDVTLPAYSETLVRIPIHATGYRLVEAQEIQENVFCASSVVECKNNFSMLGG
jgi:hypothetical protein